MRRRSSSTKVLGSTYRGETGVWELVLDVLQQVVKNRAVHVMHIGIEWVGNSVAVTIVDVLLHTRIDVLPDDLDHIQAT